VEVEIRLRIDPEMSAVQEMAGRNDGAHPALDGELEAALEEERKVSNAGKAEREKMQAARGLLSQELSIARGMSRISRAR